jgi:CRISPR-associated protein Cas1
LLNCIDRISDPAVLLGTEGQAAALYLSQFHRMLKCPVPGKGFDFKTRNRRPPRDPVNALLSFSYAVVTHPVFGYKMAYGRMVEVQARMLAAYVRGDIPDYTGFTVR